MRMNKSDSCVVVWYQRDDQYLDMEEYSVERDFPVIISINEGDYSVAVFGKSGEKIDSEPVAKKRVFSTTTQGTHTHKQL